MIKAEDRVFLVTFQKWNRNVSLETHFLASGSRSGDDKLRIVSFMRIEQHCPYDCKQTQDR